MSQGGPLKTSGTGGGTPITTINGDTGSATGATVLIYANNAGNISGSTVKFVNSGTTSTLNTSDTALANTMIGYLAGNLSITGGSNTGVGFQALTALTSASFNAALGRGAGASIQDGQGNVAIGWNALATNVSSGWNTAIGMQAGQSITGQANIAIGYQSMFLGGTTTNSIALGYQTGYGMTSGTGNVIIGVLSAVTLTSGSSNTILGNASAGAYTGAESNNILIGSGVAGVLGESNVTRIGNGQTQCFIQGISGVTVAASTAVLIDAAGQMGTILSSERYKENIVDMPNDATVMNLRPVKFNYKADEGKTTQYGLIAEEVDKEFPYLCIYKDGQPETVKYHELCVFLLAELQRLEKRINVLEDKK